MNHTPLIESLKNIRCNIERQPKEHWKTSTDVATKMIDTVEKYFNAEPVVQLDSISDSDSEGFRVRLSAGSPISEEEIII